MPTQGLSLVGFMDQVHAIAHLKHACVPANPADAALIAEWNTAKGMLGAPVANAGHPDIQPLPAAETAQVMATPWATHFFAAGGPWAGASLKLVEVKPLLAYQFTVDLDRSQHHCAALGTPPTLAELMARCLPLTWPPERIQSSQLVDVGHQSIIVRSRSLNYRVLNQGVFTQPGAHEASVGVVIGTAMPIAHVVRLNGRCYLHNGFHRAVGAGLKKATHIPCLVRDVTTPQEANIGNNTFPLTLLESGDPPTLAHFIEGRAYPVALRAHSRIVQISWSDHVVPEE
jgi:hypothetical protein